MRRRQFLATQALPTTLEVAEPDAYSLIRVSRQAMATRFEIALPFGTPRALDAAEAALDLIDELEDQLTIFREHSEVSRLNRTASDAPITVDNNLFALLEQCAVLTRETNGAFDVAAGALTKVWGFHRREGRIPTPRELANAMQASGMKHVILESQKVRYRRAGLEINLGSIGKGYALDRTATLLKEDYGINSAMLQAGGSSMLAIGTPPGNPRGWRVAIRHPHENRTLGSVRLINRAFATSAVTYQHFEYNNRKYGHVIDPRTGWPVETIASASAVAATAALADAYSTAFFVMGLDAVRSWLVNRDGIAAVILPAEASVKPVVLGSAEYSPPGMLEELHELLTLPRSVNMSNTIPMGIVYAGLAGTFLALVVATAQQKWQLRVFFLLALRFAIGWHFLFEGLHKINSHYVGLTETNRVFTSEPYFKAAPTSFGEMMRKKFDDPAAVIAARTTPSKPMSIAEFNKLNPKDQAETCPEIAAKEFDALLEATEANVKAEAETDKKDAKKAHEKELLEAEEFKELSGSAEEQSHKDSLAKDNISYWKSLAETDDSEGRKEIKKTFEKSRTESIMKSRDRLKSIIDEVSNKKNTAAETLKKKEKSAEEKATNFKVIAAERIESAKIAYAAWVYGVEGRDSKIKFTTGDAALTAPQRIAHLDWLKAEAKAAQDRVGSGIGNGNGVEMKRAAELRMEVMTAEADLARDSYALEYKKALTGKDWEIPKASSAGAAMDKITMWFIAIVGACILIGLNTRISCLLAAGFLVVTYLTHPAVPWYPLPPNTEGNPLFVNKNVIECLALLVLACYPTGSWLGLDALFSRIFLPKSEFRTPSA